MKKKYIKILISIIGILIFASGCKSEKEIDDIQAERNEQVESEENKSESTTEEDYKSVENLEEVQDMTIYYVDLETAEIVQEKIENENVKPEDVWKELQKKQLLTEECTLNSFKIEDDNSITIDVNNGFGNYLRTMGMTGEREILTGVVNSFLSTYGCEKIKITEEGSSLETGHMIYDNYMEMTY